MMAEKRSELEEQQVHLNVGLRRINETVQQVDELRTRFEFFEIHLFLSYVAKKAVLFISKLYIEKI